MWDLASVGVYLCFFKVKNGICSKFFLTLTFFSLIILTFEKHSVENRQFSLGSLRKFENHTDVGLGFQRGNSV